MKILSEKTKKEYATVEECLADEAKYDEMIAKKKEEAERKSAERKDVLDHYIELQKNV